MLLQENNLINELIKTIEEPFSGKTNKPRIMKSKGRTFEELTTVDLPRHTDLYQSSSFTLICKNERCSFKGEIVVPRDEEEIISDKVKKSDCDITSIHQHPESILAMTEKLEKGKKESHIHFKCYWKSRNDTLKFAKFLREL